MFFAEHCQSFIIFKLTMEKKETNGSKSSNHIYPQMQHFQLVRVNNSRIGLGKPPGAAGW